MPDNAEGSSNDQRQHARIGVQYATCRTCDHLILRGDIQYARLMFLKHILTPVINVISASVFRGFSIFSILRKK